MSIGSPFAARVVVTPGPMQSACHIWVGTLTDDGYAVVRKNRKKIRVHRLTYLNAVGPIPDGHVLDHLCRIRNCINPAHLEPVTNAENVRRGLVCGRGKRLTRCRHGHAYTPENSYVCKRGKLSCRACKKDACERSKARRKAAPVGAA